MNKNFESPGIALPLVEITEGGAAMKKGDCKDTAFCLDWGSCYWGCQSGPHVTAVASQVMIEIPVETVVPPPRAEL